MRQTKWNLRTWVIRWLRINGGGEESQDKKRQFVHFTCGCVVLKPGRRAHVDARKPGCRTAICAGHVRRLGSGREL
jgi:hypothetical protein